MKLIVEFQKGGVVLTRFEREAEDKKGDAEKTVREAYELFLSENPEMSLFDDVHVHFDTEDGTVSS